MSSALLDWSDDTPPPSLPLPSFAAMDYFDIVNLLHTEPKDGFEDLATSEKAISQMPTTIDNLTPIGTPATELPAGQIVISVSTAFNSSSKHGEGSPDIILTASDEVYFYVHTSRLLSVSTNQFNHILSGPIERGQQGTFSLPEDSLTLNVLLHVIYNLPLRQYSPPLETLLEGVNALKKYGVLLSQHLIRGTPLYDELLIKMPYMPLQVYAVAAENDLFDLACDASVFLLSFPLPTLTDEMALRIGPLYLRRLFSLHTERLRALQQLVVRPPPEHEPTLDCGWTDHQRLKTAWSLACASVVYDASPDLSAERIRRILGSLNMRLSCQSCKQAITQRINEIVMKWSITPRSILRHTQEYHAVAQ